MFHGWTHPGISGPANRQGMRIKCSGAIILFVEEVFLVWLTTTGIGKDTFVSVKPLIFANSNSFDHKIIIGCCKINSLFG